MAKDFSFQTVDPRNPGGPRVEVVLPGDLIERAYKFSPVRYENLRAAKHVLENPRRIFFGVREYNEGGWCYVGKPPEWCVSEGVTATFPDDKVFAVYVNPRMLIYTWRAEYAAADDPACPREWENRYRGLVWKSTS